MGAVVVAGEGLLVRKALLLCCVVLLWSPGGVAWAWGPECRLLSGQLAAAPGSLKMGDLDVLRTCITALQRAIVNNEPLPADEPAAKVECPPPPPPQVVERACPSCPACPRADDPARQRFIPRY